MVMSSRREEYESILNPNNDMTTSCVVNGCTHLHPLRYAHIKIKIDVQKIIYIVEVAYANVATISIAK